ncbi:unnamed protein product [Heligmosomoides polygyrus]|uniref:CCHC-type domain-containing protein n=1 Tax=Heligmosomoides polygyrus TaxID=6339 RepID=A0A183F6J8_HELPZ|nr:unnamed protein product [Heligmosomoides polygyrus]
MIVHRTREQIIAHRVVDQPSVMKLSVLESAEEPSTVELVVLRPPAASTLILPVVLYSSVPVVNTTNETLRGTTADSTENRVPAEVSELRVAIRDIASCDEEQLDQQLRGLSRKKRDIVLEELRNAVSMADAKMESAFQHAVGADCPAARLGTSVQQSMQDPPLASREAAAKSEQWRQSAQCAREEIEEAGNSKPWEEAKLGAAPTAAPTDLSAIIACIVEYAMPVAAGRKATEQSSSKSHTCFQCGEVGHFQQACPKKVGNPKVGRDLAKGSTEPRKAPLREGKRQDHPSFSTQLMWRRRVAGSVRDPDKAYGKPCYCEIELLGLTAEALVDTGSVVSIIPTVMLDKAKDHGIDIDGIVVEAGDPNKHRVYDASGNPMKFLKVIEVNVNVKGAR